MDPRQDVPAQDGLFDSFDPDALYNQGMAYYRRRHWQEARRCFERVKALQPNRRGIDALIRELDIFLQLESVGSESPTSLTRQEIIQATPSAASSGALAEAQPGGDDGSGARRGRGCWLWLVVILVAAAVVGIVLLYLLQLPPFASNNSVESLRVRCRSNLVAQNWCVALGACSRLSEMAPDDLDALNGVTKSMAALYDEALAYSDANDPVTAIANLECIAESDPDYEDVQERLASLRQDQQAAQLHQEARAYLETRAYGDAEIKLLQIREMAPEYRPGTVSDDLFEVFMGRGSRYLAIAADEIRPAQDPRPGEPGYAITDGVLEKVRQARIDFGKALAERTESRDARLAEFLSSYLLEGLGRYSEWGWQEAIDALTEIYLRKEGYIDGKAALLLCDAYQHLGDFYQANDDFKAALTQYSAMQAVPACDQSEALALAQTMEYILTPTATATATIEPTPTATLTFTPRPTPTLSVTPIPTPTWTPTIPPTPTLAPQTGSGSDPKPKPRPTQKPRR